MLNPRLTNKHVTAISTMLLFACLLYSASIHAQKVKDHGHWEEYIYTEKTNRLGLITMIGVDFIPNKFDAFERLLGEHNTDLMNSTDGNLSLEMALTYRKFFAGIAYGLGEVNDHKHDELKIDFRTTQYGLQAGYNLVDGSRLLLGPRLGLKWNRYRLLNYDKDRRIDLEEYIKQRDLDLRLNQATGFAGLNIALKLYDNNLLGTDYWAIGMYGGYNFKLHDLPLMYSRGNKLMGNYKIGMSDFSFGFYFAWVVD
jgi:hypothetical protein